MRVPLHKRLGSIAPYNDSLRGKVRVVSSSPYYFSRTKEIFRKVEVIWVTKKDDLSEFPNQQQDFRLDSGANARLGDSIQPKRHKQAWTGICTMLGRNFNPKSSFVKDVKDLRSNEAWLSRVSEHDVS